MIIVASRPFNRKNTLHPYQFAAYDVGLKWKNTAEGVINGWVYKMKGCEPQKKYERRSDINIDPLKCWEAVFG